MSYKTVVLDHASKTKDMASAVEHKANEMAEKGFELITLSITEPVGSCLNTSKK